MARLLGISKDSGICCHPRTCVSHAASQPLEMPRQRLNGESLELKNCPAKLFCFNRTCDQKLNGHQETLPCSHLKPEETGDTGTGSCDTHLHCSNGPSTRAELTTPLLLGSAPRTAETHPRMREGSVGGSYRPHLGQVERRN